MQNRLKFELAFNKLIIVYAVKELFILRNIICFHLNKLEDIANIRPRTIMGKVRKHSQFFIYK